MHFLDSIKAIAKKLPFVGGVLNAALEAVSWVLLIVLNFQFLGLVCGAGCFFLLIPLTIGFLILECKRKKISDYDNTFDPEVGWKDPKRDQYLVEKPRPDRNDWIYYESGGSLRYRCSVGWWRIKKACWQIRNFCHRQEVLTKQEMEDGKLHIGWTPFQILERRRRNVTECSWRLATIGMFILGFTTFVYTSLVFTVWAFGLLINLALGIQIHLGWIILILLWTQLGCAIVLTWFWASRVPSNDRRRNMFCSTVCMPFSIAIYLLTCCACLRPLRRLCCHRQKPPIYPPPYQQYQQSTTARINLDNQAYKGYSSPGYSVLPDPNSRIFLPPTSVPGNPRPPIHPPPYQQYQQPQHPTLMQQTHSGSATVFPEVPEIPRPSIAARPSGASSNSVHSNKSGSPSMSIHSNESRSLTDDPQSYAKNAWLAKQAEAWDKMNVGHLSETNNAHSMQDVPTKPLGPQSSWPV